MDEKIIINNPTLAESIPHWIKQGEKLIYPQRSQKWQDCVKIRANDLFNGTDLDCALEIMKLLEKGDTLEHARDLLKKQNHSSLRYARVVSLVTNFSKRGTEFYKFINKKLSPAEEIVIMKLEQENAEFAKESEPANND